jgi:2-methylisocitrate lyase-like PEP mutase family enzyme
VSETADLAALAERLRALHQGELLVLPNVWDAASARVVADAGFPAIATASAAITAMLGHPDGEGAPWQEMFAANARIARAVDVPVSMDAEAGYQMSPDDLVDRLLEIGVVGCNLEDSDHRRGGLVDAEVHARWLAGVRGAADRSGVPIVVNARVDVFLPDSGIEEPDRTAEAIRRGRLYREAGVDCVYPIGVGDPEVLAALVSGVGGAVNGNRSARLDLRTLQELGVARVSYGPTFYRSALAGFAEAVRHLT